MPDITTVNDRKVPTKLDPECTRSAQKGSQGNGLNDKSMNESQRDNLNQYADTNS